MKICRICKENKSLNNFHKDTSIKSGYRNECGSCRTKNKKIKSYIQTNKLELTCKTCNQIKSTSSFDKNKRHSTGYMIHCKECRKEVSKKDYKSNSEVKKQKNLDYYKNNKQKVLKSQLERQKERTKSDSTYKLVRNLRNRLYYALLDRPWKKNTHFSEYIGCSQKELKIHIEKQFKENMNWGNYGNWHIDHIHPLSLANTEQELYQLCHYTNLQPMWAIDNIKKSNNVEQNTVKTHHKECKNS